MGVVSVYKILLDWCFRYIKNILLCIKMSSRVVPNKCVHTRAEIEGRAYRIVSFFHGHPSEISEDGWSVFRADDEVYLVDKLTIAVLAEHECEFLTREVDKQASEPSIVAVLMKSVSRDELKLESI